MPITLSCACGKKLRVPDTAAGKKAKCPQCAALIAIPKAAPPPSDEIAFRDEPEPAAPPPGASGVPGRVELLDCWSCGRKNDSQLENCRFCGAPRDAANKKVGSFVPDVLLSYVWGFKGIGSLAVICIVMILILLCAGIALGMVARASKHAGWIAQLVVSLWGQAYMTSLFVQMVKGGSLRSDDFPDLPTPFEFGAMFPPFLKILAWTFVTQLPAFAVAFLAAGSRNPLAVLAAAPVALLCSPVTMLGILGICLHDTLFGLSPVGILKSIGRALPQILLLMLMLGVCWGVSALTVFGVAFVIAAIGIAVNSCLVSILLLFVQMFVVMLVSLYFLSVQARMLGLLGYHCEDRLELVRGNR